ncbi:glycosyltransferase family 2 protein [Xanthocytophaga flava]|uniref:glycosyltransferase family 2 protein n=1 Tax=Xanthocytophaga flava TaxID=3048013 RepID=UPI0028D056CB|nr:glycosyltransferase family 2 protein [Xanthocytophaga flavus]MDJ1468285.1 glycosyltransferase family 2 protein [Xanthocytophaga flavus]
MIWIVIPVFNRKNFTRECLLSLRKQTVQDFKVVIVDDGSTDGTDEMVKTEFPEVILIDGGGDLFWTAAVNMGIQYALDHGAEAVMTLNNDTLPTEDFIEKTIEASKKDPKGVIGALEIDVATKNVIYGGEKIDWVLATTKNIIDGIPAPKRTGLHPVSWLPGRGLLIPRAVFEKVGLFDAARFPHYYGDVDFTHTALRNGFPNYINYDAKLMTYPEESGDRKNKVKKNFKNYYNHLFSIKGGGNLKDFTRFTFKNCPFYFVPSYLLIGYLRRMGGYFVH